MDAIADIPPRIGLVEPNRPRTCEICGKALTGPAIWWRTYGEWYTCHAYAIPDCLDRLVLARLLQLVT